MTTPRKSCLLCALGFVLPLSILLLEVLPWILRYGTSTDDHCLSALCLVNAAIWMTVLWWALHQLVFQLAGLWPVKVKRLPDVPNKPVRFAVLYLTCDDFVPECCASCLRQDYPQDAFRVAVCDDSRLQPNRTAVDHFCAEYRLTAIRRRLDGPSGYKAGNLNHAFAEFAKGQCDWVVVVDADQILPEVFLSTLARFVSKTAPDVAFVQAGRAALSEMPHMHRMRESSVLATTRFQSALQSEILIFFERDMFWRQRYGFFPFLGHGGAIRERAWEQLGGFPLVVSEDFAFAMQAAARGQYGERVEQVRSGEAYPKDFPAFLVRITKFASGAAELLCSRFWKFAFDRLTSRAMVEAYDAGMLLATYAFVPLILFNVLLSAYTCSRLWVQGAELLAPGLSYLFLGMFFVSFAVSVSVSPSAAHAARHWFWAFGVYSSAMPLVGYSFVRALFRKPAFLPTPKFGHDSPAFAWTGAVSYLLVRLRRHWLGPGGHHSARSLRRTQLRIYCFPFFIGCMRRRRGEAA